MKENQSQKTFKTATNSSEELLGNNGKDQLIIQITGDLIQFKHYNQWPNPDQDLHLIGARRVMQGHMSYLHQWIIRKIKM